LYVLVVRYKTFSGKQLFSEANMRAEMPAYFYNPADDKADIS
jgi:hypothetical protein